MIKVTITCPVTWREQYKWIIEHCKAYKDVTSWYSVVAGVGTIEIFLEEQDATMFYLRWVE